MNRGKGLPRSKVKLRGQQRRSEIATECQTRKTDYHWRLFMVFWIPDSSHPLRSAAANAKIAIVLGLKSTRGSRGDAVTQLKKRTLHREEENGRAGINTKFHADNCDSGSGMNAVRPAEFA